MSARQSLHSRDDRERMRSRSPSSRRDRDGESLPAKRDASGNRDARAPERETDSHRVAQRQKQVDFGYNTLAYDNYTLAVPKRERKADKVEHPRTPDVQKKCSKRAFDGLIRVWKQQLHSHWAPSCDGEGDGDDNSMSSDEAPGAKAAQASTHSAAKEVDEEGAGEFWSQLKGD